MALVDSQQLQQQQQQYSAAPLLTSRVTGGGISSTHGIFAFSPGLIRRDRQQQQAANGTAHNQPIQSLLQQQRHVQGLPLTTSTAAGAATAAAPLPRAAIAGDISSTIAPATASIADDVASSSLSIGLHNDVATSSAVNVASASKGLWDWDVPTAIASSFSSSSLSLPPGVTAAAGMPAAATSHAPAAAAGSVHAPPLPPPPSSSAWLNDTRALILQRDTATEHAAAAVHAATGVDLGGDGDDDVNAFTAAATGSPSSNPGRTSTSAPHSHVSAVSSLSGGYGGGDTATGSPEDHRAVAHQLQLHPTDRAALKRQLLLPPPSQQQRQHSTPVDSSFEAFVRDGAAAAHHQLQLPVESSFVSGAAARAVLDAGIAEWEEEHRFEIMPGELEAAAAGGVDGAAGGAGATVAPAHPLSTSNSDEGAAAWGYTPFFAGRSAPLSKKGTPVEVTSGSPPFFDGRNAPLSDGRVGGGGAVLSFYSPQQQQLFGGDHHTTPPAVTTATTTSAAAAASALRPSSVRRKVDTGLLPDAPSTYAHERANTQQQQRYTLQQRASAIPAFPFVNVLQVPRACAAPLLECSEPVAWPPATSTSTAASSLIIPVRNGSGSSSLASPSATASPSPHDSSSTGTSLVVRVSVDKLSFSLRAQADGTGTQLQLGSSPVSPTTGLSDVFSLSPSEFTLHAAHTAAVTLSCSPVAAVACCRELFDALAGMQLRLQQRGLEAPAAASVVVTLTASLSFVSLPAAHIAAGAAAGAAVFVLPLTVRFSVAMALATPAAAVAAAAVVGAARPTMLIHPHAAAASPSPLPHHVIRSADARHVMRSAASTTPTDVLAAEPAAVAVAAAAAAALHTLLPAGAIAMIDDLHAAVHKLKLDSSAPAKQQQHSQQQRQQRGRRHGRRPHSTSSSSRCSVHSSGSGSSSGTTTTNDETTEREDRGSGRSRSQHEAAYAHPTLQQHRVHLHQPSQVRSSGSNDRRSASRGSARVPLTCGLRESDAEFDAEAYTDPDEVVRGEAAAAVGTIAGSFGGAIAFAAPTESSGYTGAVAPQKATAPYSSFSGGVNNAAAPSSALLLTSVASPAYSTSSSRSSSVLPREAAAYIQRLRRMEEATAAAAALSARATQSQSSHSSSLSSATATVSSERAAEADAVVAAAAVTGGTPFKSSITGTTLYGARRRVPGFNNINYSNNNIDSRAHNNNNADSRAGLYINGISESEAEHATTRPAVTTQTELDAAGSVMYPPAAESVVVAAAEVDATVPSHAAAVVEVDVMNASMASYTAAASTVAAVAGEANGSGSRRNGDGPHTSTQTTIAAVRRRRREGATGAAMTPVSTRKQHARPRPQQPHMPRATAAAMAYATTAAAAPAPRAVATTVATAYENAAAHAAPLQQLQQRYPATSSSTAARLRAAFSSSSARATAALLQWQAALGLSDADAGGGEEAESSVCDTDTHSVSDVEHGHEHQHQQRPRGSSGAGDHDDDGSTGNSELQQRQQMMLHFPYEDDEGEDAVGSTGHVNFDEGGDAEASFSVSSDGGGFSPFGGVNFNFGEASLRRRSSTRPHGGGGRRSAGRGLSMLDQQQRSGAASAVSSAAAVSAAASVSEALFTGDCDADGAPLHSGYYYDEEGEGSTSTWKGLGGDDDEEEHGGLRFHPRHGHSISSGDLGDADARTPRGRYDEEEGEGDFYSPALRLSTSCTRKRPSTYWRQMNTLHKLQLAQQQWRQCDEQQQGEGEEEGGALQRQQLDVLARLEEAAAAPLPHLQLESIAAGPAVQQRQQCVVTSPCVAHITTPRTHSATAPTTVAPPLQVCPTSDTQVEVSSTAAASLAVSSQTPLSRIMNARAVDSISIADDEGTLPALPFSEHGAQLQLASAQRQQQRAKNGHSAPLPHQYPAAPSEMPSAAPVSSSTGALLTSAAAAAVATASVCSSRASSPLRGPDNEGRGGAEGRPAKLDPAAAPAASRLQPPVLLLGAATSTSNDAAWWFVHHATTSITIKGESSSGSSSGLVAFTAATATPVAASVSPNSGGGSSIVIVNRSSQPLCVVALDAKGRSLSLSREGTAEAAAATGECAEATSTSSPLSFVSPLPSGPVCVPARGEGTVRLSLALPHAPPAAAAASSSCASQSSVCVDVSAWTWNPFRRTLSAIVFLQSAGQLTGESSSTSSAAAVAAVMDGNSALLRGATEPLTSSPSSQQLPQHVDVSPPQQRQLQHLQQVEVNPPHPLRGDACHVRVCVHESAWGERGWSYDPISRELRVQQQSQQHVTAGSGGSFISSWGAAIAAAAAAPTLPLTTAGDGEVEVVPTPRRTVTLHSPHRGAATSISDTSSSAEGHRCILLPLSPGQQRGESTETAGTDAGASSSPLREIMASHGAAPSALMSTSTSGSASASRRRAAANAFTGSRSPLPRAAAAARAATTTAAAGPPLWSPSGQLLQQLPFGSPNDESLLMSPPALGMTVRDIEFDDEEGEEGAEEGVVLRSNSSSSADGGGASGHATTGTTKRSKRHQQHGAKRVPLRVRIATSSSSSGVAAVADARGGGSYSGTVSNFNLDRSGGPMGAIPRFVQRTMRVHAPHRTSTTSGAAVTMPVTTTTVAAGGAATAGVAVSAPLPSPSRGRLTGSATVPAPAHAHRNDHTSHASPSPMRWPAHTLMPTSAGAAPLAPGSPASSSVLGDGIAYSVDSAPRAVPGMYFAMRTVYFPHTAPGGSTRVRIQLCNTSHSVVRARVSLSLASAAAVDGSGGSAFHVKRGHRTLELKPLTYCMLPVTFRPPPSCSSSAGASSSSSGGCGAVQYHAVLMVQAAPVQQHMGDGGGGEGAPGLKTTCRALLVGEATIAQ